MSLNSDLSIKTEGWYEDNLKVGAMKEDHVYKFFAVSFNGF